MPSLLFTAMLVLTQILCSDASAATPRRPPEIHGRDLVTGKNIDVVNLSGKPVALVFLSSFCPCSDSHRPELAKLQKDFPNALIIGVNANADEDLVDAKKYFEKSELPFPVIRDPGSKLANEYKALRTPHAFLFSPQGDLIFQGGVSSTSHFEDSAQKYLREALEDVTAGVPVRTAKARPLGCLIERETH